MRRSLFESHSAPTPARPRLQPNGFAKLARFSFRHALAIIVMWLVFSAAILATGFFSLGTTRQEPLDFSATSPATKNLATLKENFPNLESLIAINISNASSDKLQLDRANLVQALENKKDVFDLVYAPGTGSYYETHGILYHSLEEIKARVAYARSLHPLFSAIVEAPTTESLATLVNEVSASIELGRDPQGLDALFSESAKSIQALIQGNERLVDWTHVAGLNIDAQPVSALVFVLPKITTGKSAATEIATILEALPRADGTTTIVDQVSEVKAVAPPIARPQVMAGIAMAAIFMIFALVFMVGDFNLSAMIMLPVLITKAFMLGALFYVLPKYTFALWPLIIAIGIITVQLSTRHGFAALDALKLGRGKESAVMFAAQKQGRGIMLLSVMMIAVWAAGLAVGDAVFTKVSAIMALSIVITVLSTLTLVPALVCVLPGAPVWRAGEWLELLHQSFFRNNMWRTLRAVLTLAIIAMACAGLWFSPQLLTNPQQKVEADVAVNILARSPQEAEAFVKKLKTIPQAQSVRWLGAFLPQQVDDKLAALQGLKDNFARITPLIPQNPEILREHIGTLQESLQAIANSSATRPELAAAAQEFRRSLELLASTSSNVEVHALENRIFGSFNILPDLADSLTALGKPSLDSLDPRLKTLFLSPQNQFRLEVTPQPSQSNLSLARVLAVHDFPVAHPSLVVQDGFERLQRNSILLTAALFGAGLLMLVFATLEFAGFFASALAMIIMMGLLAAAATGLQIQLSADHLIVFIIICAFAFAIVATAFLKERITNTDALHAIEAWMPAALLIAITTPALFVKLDSYAPQLLIITLGVCAVTIMTTILLRPLTLILRGEF
jgi:uncharacterized protein